MIPQFRIAITCLIVISVEPGLNPSLVQVNIAFSVAFLSVCELG
jgi:hypothetical protein